MCTAPTRMHISVEDNLGRALREENQNQTNQEVKSRSQTKAMKGNGCAELVGDVSLIGSSERGKKKENANFVTE
ncbi:hypothetical protein CEXT_736411 [Caerostris extrusa]|uniref:Uncharacterized protein n=1 Tax=Caerostris extrusa TaxID=172846 RepID=A0AAV4X083_CAEEX|nr:hypothetical protein CEXT_736411 [Caerostris extrusa]